MALLTAAQLQDHLDTGLSTVALQRVLDSVDADIIRACGPHDGERIEVVTPQKTDPWLAWVSAPIASVASVTTRAGNSEPETVTEYEVRGAAVRRSTGAWRQYVTVTYTPYSTNALREMATINLTRLELERLGYAAEREGNLVVTAAHYARERREILRSVAPARL